MAAGRLGPSELDTVNQELRARNRQQSAVAALGQAAIRGDDLATLMDEATRVVAETLGAQYSAVLELLPAGNVLLLRVGVGWRSGLVGHHTVPTGVGSLAGFVLSSDRPVVVTDMVRDTRFGQSPALLEHGIVSSMLVIVRGRTRPWGTLGVHTTRPRSFSPDDIGFLQSIANVLALAIERHEVEVAQRREKETLEALFDNIPLMIGFYDANGRVVRVNRQWEETLGWTLEAAQEVDLLAEVFPDPDLQARARAFIRRTERRWADFPMRTRDGKEIAVSWATFTLSDGSHVGFGLDVTERKRAEAALAESEARFAKIFQASPVALGMATIAEGRMLDVNESWLELYGYRRDEVLGRTNAELDLSVDREARTATARRVSEEGVARNVEMQVRRKSGEVRDLIVSAVPVNLAGEQAAWLTAQIDITDRKQAEEERARLFVSETRARTLAETALERLHAIQSITDSALHHLGLDELLHELLGRLQAALDADSAIVLLLDEERTSLCPRAVHGNVHPRVGSMRIPLGQGVAGRAAAEGRALIVDDYATVDLSRLEGVPAEDIRALVRSAMAAPLRIAGKIVGVVGVATGRPRRFTEQDLDLLQLVADRMAPSIERGRLLETVRAGRERMETLSRRLLTAQEEERRRLAVELHDELGQVLTAVKINLASLERLSGAAPAPAHLRDAIGSVDRAMERVRDLALDLRPSVLDDLGLPAALRWYVDRFARNSHVEVNVSIDAVPYLEAGLETACFRVAQEALTNVARHAQARQVWLDLHLLADGLELRVRDDGIGFEAGGARERAMGGASIGLLGMQERVSLAGGEFEIRSALGRGTEVRARFTVTRTPE